MLKNEQNPKLTTTKGGASLLALVLTIGLSDMNRRLLNTRTIGKLASTLSFAVFLIFSSNGNAQCSGTESTGNGAYVSEDGVAGDPTAAGGAADGTFTGNLAGADNLTLSYTLAGAFPSASSDICITVGFNNANGVVNFNDGATTHTFSNNTDGDGSTGYAPQEFCFTYTGAGPLNVIITESGGGNIRVDGSTYTSCVPACSDPDLYADNCDFDSDGVLNGIDQDDDNDGILDTDETIPCPPVSNEALGKGAGDYLEDGVAGVGILQADGSVNAWINEVLNTDIFGNVNATYIATLEAHAFINADNGNSYVIALADLNSRTNLSLSSPIADVSGDHAIAVAVLEDGSIVGLSTNSYPMGTVSINMGGIPNSDFTRAFAGSNGGASGYIYVQKSDGTVYRILDINQTGNFDGSLQSYSNFDNAIKITDSGDFESYAVMPDGTIVKDDGFGTVTTINPPAGENYIDIKSTLGDAFLLTDVGNVYRSTIYSPQSATQVSGLSGIDQLGAAEGDAGYNHMIAVDFDTNTAYFLDATGTPATLNIPAGYTIVDARAYSGAVILALENSSGDLEIWGATDPKAPDALFPDHIPIDLPNVQLLSASPAVSSSSGGSGGSIADCGSDIDNDGIDNQFDTDSDADGCPDAIEGGGTFTVTNIDGNDMLTGGVDSGTGIPTTAGSGQTVGDSQDNATNSCPPCNAGTEPPSFGGN